jgi:hypothetical protein
MKSLKTLLLTVAPLFLLSTFSACEFSRNEESNGPIVLGDPSTIVTETDSQYLDDLVMDMPQANDSLNPPVYKDNFKNVEAAAALSQQLAKDSIAEEKAKQTKEPEPTVTPEKTKKDKKTTKQKVDKKDTKTVAKRDTKNKKDEKKKKGNRR